MSGDRGVSGLAGLDLAAAGEADLERADLEPGVGVMERRRARVAWEAPERDSKCEWASLWYDAYEVDIFVFDDDDDDDVF